LIEDAGSIESVWIAGALFRHLWDYAEKTGAGYAFMDGLQLRCFADDPDRIRKPDTCFVRKDRLDPAEFSQGFCPVAPDVVVEVVSPNDGYYEVERKVNEYLDAGVQLVWIVSPESRTVIVYDLDRRIEHLKSSQQLTGGTVLSGFTCPVNSLFPPAGTTAGRKSS
jgi:Uma2 family endonuclease